MPHTSSYCGFAGRVELAYWWSCIGKGLQLTGLPRLVYWVIGFTAKAVPPNFKHAKVSQKV